MSSKDAETPRGASGSRWEPTDATATDLGALPPTPAQAPAAANPRWRPSRTLGVAASAAMAGLLLGGAGGWALSSTGHEDDFRQRPALVGFPGQPGGDELGPGAPGGPGVLPGQPQLGQGDDDGDNGGQNS